MKLTSTIISFLLVFVMGCDEAGPGKRPEIIFQFEYINYAWSFQHHGFFIDEEGNIISYEKPAGWVFPEKNSISVDDLAGNLAKALVLKGRIEQNKLMEMTGIAAGISNESLTRPENKMADAGTAGYFFYRLNNEAGRYDLITLLQRGDWSQENKGADAAKLINWLLEINNGGMYDF